MPEKVVPLLFLVVLFSYTYYNFLDISNLSFTEKNLGSRQLWTACHIPVFCGRLTNFLNIQFYRSILPHISQCGKKNILTDSNIFRFSITNKIQKQKAHTLKCILSNELFSSSGYLEMIEMFSEYLLLSITLRL